MVYKTSRQLREINKNWGTPLEKPLQKKQSQQTAFFKLSRGGTMSFSSVMGTLYHKSAMNHALLPRGRAGRRGLRLAQHLGQDQPRREPCVLPALLLAAPPTPLLGIFRERAHSTHPHRKMSPQYVPLQTPKTSRQVLYTVWMARICQMSL